MTYYLLSCLIYFLIQTGILLRFKALRRNPVMFAKNVASIMPIAFVWPLIYVYKAYRYFRPINRASKAEIDNHFNEQMF